MHLVFMTRGIDKQVQELRARLNAQMFSWKRKNLDTGKEELNMVQGALRPIQIWEYVFPEEHLKNVLVGMGIAGPIKRPEIKKASWFLRKMLRLGQVPEVDGLAMGYRPAGTLNGEPMPATLVHNMITEGVAVYPVGIKKDPIQDYDWGGKVGNYHQEGL